MPIEPMRFVAAAMLAALLGGLPESVAAEPEKTVRFLGERYGQWATTQPATIFTARKILTGDPGRPVATAVAVAGGHVLSVGTLDAVSRSLGERPFDIDRRLEGKVIVPGFIDANADPVFAALALGAEIIAAEAWRIPGHPGRVALSPTEYLDRIADASTKLSGPGETLFTWGHEPRIHGAVGRSELDKASPRRAVVVWNRTGDTLIFNSAALGKYAITEGIPAQARYSGAQQEAVLPLVAKDLFTPRRFAAGMQALRRWLPASGITAIVHPGAQTAMAPQHSIELALDDPSTPFRTFFIPDGTAIFDSARRSGELDEVIRRTQRYATLGRGRVQWLPQQVAIRMATPKDSEAALRMYWDAGYQIHVQASDDVEARRALNALRDRLAVDRRVDHRLTVTLPANSSARWAGEFAPLGALVAPLRPGLPERLRGKDLGSITREPAFAIQRDNLVGSIKPGAHADFAILEADPTDTTRLEEIRVWGTVFSGRVQRAASGPDEDPDKGRTPGTPPTQPRSRPR